MSVLNTFFKDSQLKNNSFKNYNTSISYALDAYVFIKTYYLKSLRSALRHSLVFPSYQFYKTLWVGGGSISCAYKKLSGWGKRRKN